MNHVAGLLPILVLSVSQLWVSAAAATYTGSFSVTLTVQPSCTFSTTAMNFGSYTGIQADAVGTIIVTCTNTTSYYLNLSQGNNYGCCFYDRMAGPGGVLLTYDVYSDPARTTFWGGTYNRDGVAGTGTGAAQTVSAYGRIRAGQYKAPGAYTDTVVVTITY